MRDIKKSTILCWKSPYLVDDMKITIFGWQLRKSTIFPWELWKNTIFRWELWKITIFGWDMKNHHVWLRYVKHHKFGWELRKITIFGWQLWKITIFDCDIGKKSPYLVQWLEKYPHTVMVKRKKITIQYLFERKQTISLENICLRDRKQQR